MMLTYEQIKQNEQVNTYIREANDILGELGFTEHGFAHVTKVALCAGMILEKLGYSERDIELAKIAGYMHDIGNIVNRIEHAQSGALMAFRILDHLDVDPRETALIVSAIGNHDEHTAMPINHISAALIIADKSDVRESRVRNIKRDAFDIHDSVNYSVKKSSLDVLPDEKKIRLSLSVDTEVSSVMDYFEIFLVRMKLCKAASEKLGMVFELEINGQRLA
ncbi:MAG: HD domain-containing protein [Clostridia bacterium]|nr:HD domain-containing protein [Clostridia bacterium]